VNIVVDTNIIFSAILNSRGKIGELLINKPFEINYLAPDFLLSELQLHSTKIKKISGLNLAQYEAIKKYVIQHIAFIDLNSISRKSWEIAIDLIGKTDEMDIPFVALAIQLNAFLWTGDKKLIKELAKKNFESVLSTDLLYLKYFG